jgi:hypothetical protein
MPAWHVACAAVELAVREPYFVPKALSALFGGLTPAVTFFLARRVTENRATPWIAWAIAAVSPLHVLYSATAMTEAFFGFWFLLSVLLFLKDRVIGSAAAMAPAAFTRFDVWILLIVLPALAFLQMRARGWRLAAACGLFALPVLLWLGLNAAVTGDPMNFSKVNSAYVKHFFEFNPSMADRGPGGFAFHFGSVLIAAGASVWALGIWGLAAVRTRETRALAVILGAAFGYMFALWLVRMHAGWMRYYMAMGMILAAAAALRLEGFRWRRVALAAVAVEVAILAVVHAQMTSWPRRLREAADFVRARPGLAMSDEPGVRVMAGRGRFVESHDLPKTPEAVLTHLRERGVRWLVYTDADYSAFPDLFPAMRRGDAPEGFRLAFTPPSNSDAVPRLYVYEVAP